MIDWIGAFLGVIGMIILCAFTLLVGAIISIALAECFVQLLKAWP